MERSSRILVLLPFAPAEKDLEAERRKAKALIADIVQNDGDIQRSPTHLQKRSEEGFIPWHISNKYYQADVHFKISLYSFQNPSRSAPTRRKAIVKNDPSSGSLNGTLTLSNEHDGDADMMKKVRNVFEALQQPGNTAKAFETSDDRIRALAEEVQDVDAVIVIVDSNKPLQNHRALLDTFKKVYKDQALLSGFDLAIGLVVAIPSFFEDDSQSSGLIATAEQLTAAYAEEGWEYIDLEDFREDFAHSSSDSQEEAFDGSSDPRDDEKQGVERIREALETHTWPNLKRRKDHWSKGASKEAELAGIDFEDTDIDIERALAALEIDSVHLDDTHVSAEPSEQDEALAREFLKSILKSQSSASESSSTDTRELKPPKSLKEMHQELETFLENTDLHWPVRHDAAPSESQIVGATAWPSLSTKSSVDQKEAFDDDFSNFVSAEDMHQCRNSLSGDLNPLDDIFDADADLDFDDVALLKALQVDAADHLPALSTGEQADASFSSTLSAIVAQAGRVRSIKDVEKRRQEAARIALAMVQGQP